jgi:hypothetical protein
MSLTGLLKKSSQNDALLDQQAQSFLTFQSGLSVKDLQFENKKLAKKIRRLESAAPAIDPKELVNERIVQEQRYRNSPFPSTSDDMKFDRWSLKER